MMRIRATIIVAIVLLLALAIGAQAATTIIESKTSGGVQGPLFTMSGPATTSVKSTVAGLTGVGSWYAGEATPSKWGEWAFTPAITGYYTVSATWATNAYVGTSPTWTVRSAEADVVTAVGQGSGANAWNTLATGKKFNAATQYKTKLATPVSTVAGKRTYFDSVRWVSVAPTVAALTGPANNAIDVGTQNGPNVSVTLSWTAGSYNSFFDVFFGTSSNPTTKIGADLAGGTTSLVVSNLDVYTQYYWKVTAKNVDASAATTVRSFTTVPEPSSILALGAGLMGLVAFARKRRA